ncbi:murein L,D-transpeptidase catalytic domain family protein [Luteimonas sp. SJ-92]|uniref:Murein L,D-transpeptidase catalytic domain family protein n=1 Tax=Luteimonas salinisoli TaxID=2752307 RepID=A0A853JET1_9GAMM|nr:murein L,D-transpeptidase catalytic domain family protein [Luteimonas salinisoli]NZA27843.1 murein L,D-transpeptidase catalytic domain family protein [Luteimonas salinisoli]
MYRPLLLLLALAAAPGAAAAPDNAPRRGLQGSGTALLGVLRAAAPDADPHVLELALRARSCAVRSGAATADARLALIDYSRPSTEPRLWVFDLAQPRLLYVEHVAHGRNSGDNLPSAFSNREGSYQSSIGLFTTSETYHGGNGYSLRMDGLEPGVNDAARARAIVMHGAPYVNPEQARKQGRLGRSLGCPALRPVAARQVIDTLKGGHLLFAYYPDQAWLQRSRFLACEAGPAAEPRAG